MFGYTGKDAVVLKDAKNEKLRFFHIMNKGAKISDDETSFKHIIISLKHIYGHFSNCLSLKHYW